MDSLLRLLQRQLEASTGMVELAFTLRTDIQNADWLGEAFVTEGLYLDQERFWWHRASLLDAESEPFVPGLNETESCSEIRLAI